jgi:hypothetical protein
MNDSTGISNHVGARNAYCNIEIVGVFYLNIGKMPGKVFSLSFSNLGMNKQSHRPTIKQLHFGISRECESLAYLEFSSSSSSTLSDERKSNVARTEASLSMRAPSANDAGNFFPDDLKWKKIFVTSKVSRANNLKLTVQLTLSPSFYKMAHSPI